jgi:hypothetical protein
MRRIFVSFYRITSWAGFLTVALILGFLFWYLPGLLSLDEFQPRVTRVLESTFHCKALVGEIRGQLIPSPGLIIAPVVLLQDVKAPSILASVGAVHMSLSVRPLLKGHLEIKAIRFVRPRFIAHRIRGSSGESRWVMLPLPNTPSAGDTVGIDAWQVRNGRIEIWDETRRPVAQWVAEQLNGDFWVRDQKGALAGKASALGRRAILDIHYAGADPFPIQARLNHMDIGALQFLLPMSLVRLEGPTDLSLRTRFQPVTEIRARLNQPLGAGEIQATIRHETGGSWRWSALGKHTRLNGTVFEAPEWSAKEDRDGLAIYVRGTTPENGTAEVGWTKPANLDQATLDVNVSSLTIRHILEIFNAASGTPAAGSSFNPHGYESWRISQGSMKALMHGTTSFEITEGDIDAGGMHLDLTGTFDLAKINPRAHIQGDVLNIPVATAVETFFPAPSPITGFGTANFNLSFAISENWVKGLSGPLEIHVKNGVLKTLKTMYRISAVLNLGNYLRLRFPHLTAKGIEFNDLSGHLTFQNGVLSTEDFFLKSPNMNIGVKGSVDLPARKVKATLRLEMLRFLEDILRDVPITHWIFKKPNKIFLPLVVVLEGPWNDIEAH